MRRSIRNPTRRSRKKLSLAAFYRSTLPRSFVNCTEDIALPPGPFGWFPRMFQRLGLCRLVQMPGSHETLLTNPDGLASKLIEGGSRLMEEAQDYETASGDQHAHLRLGSEC